ncbi:MAG: hypothetical protein ACRDTD_30070, partial [Pseudonocardiaceae bacterium]
LDVADGVTIFLLGGRLFKARAKRQAGGPDAVASILRAAAELRGRSVTSQVALTSSTDQTSERRLLAPSGLHPRGHFRRST